MKYGLWIDHRQAIIVMDTGSERAIRIVESGAAKHVASSEKALSGSHFDGRNGPRHDAKHKYYTEKITQYYDSVLDALKDAEKFVLFGPGEAREEFVRHAKRRKADRRIAGTEAMDRVTENQLIARVREYPDT